MGAVASQTHRNSSIIELDPTAGRTWHNWSRVLTAALLVTAAAKVLAGVVGVIASAYVKSAVPLVIPPWVSLVQMGVFTTAGALLIFGSGGQGRPIDLGTAFVLVASSFARRPLAILADVSGSTSVQFLSALAVDAYLPYFLWRFFRDFPRGVARWRVLRVERLAVATSGIIATLLLVANAMLGLFQDPPHVLSALAAGVPSSQFWTVVYGLSLPVVPFALWKTSTARIEERRRLMLLLAGLLAAAAPVCLYILLFSISPAFAAAVNIPRVHAIVMPVLQILIGSVPFTTAYAILVERVFDVRLLLRLALQYSLARIVVAAVAAGPFVWAASYLYGLRDQTLTVVLSGRDALPLVAAAALGAGAIQLRRRAVDVIDRTFFRDRYDARQILLGLTQQSRSTLDAHQLAELLVVQIDRALHLESITVLTADLETEELRPLGGAGRPLGIHSELAIFIADKGEPLPVELEKPGSIPQHLSPTDLDWLGDTGARLLVPLLSSTRALIGLIVLGMKRSELAYSREDRQLLSLIAASAAMTIEMRGLLGSHDGGERAFDRSWRETPAKECGACHALHSSISSRCSLCDHEHLSTAAIPHVFLDKFRLESRIGQGGMGIVYRAVDLVLRRSVALKTLPKTSPEDSVRLRREARAMAAVVHPNLVLIYGVETWKGTPVLIVEFLDGGTLADRILRTGRLPVGEALDLAVVLAGVLETLHSAGILHRDVKPSNIGYTATGIAKVLDFGLARMLPDARASSAPVSMSRNDQVSVTSASETNAVAGTPLYMSPESLFGEPPDSSLDLWGAAVVLFEALTGVHPFRKATWPDTFRAITRAEFPDVRQLVTGIPEELSAFFGKALARDRRRRPASAAEFQRQLESVVLAGEHSTVAAPN